MKTQITMEIFKQALIALDRKLDIVRRESSVNLPMYIKAIGGFALLFHSVRTSGYTADIDSITPDYDPLVIKCINETAREFDLEPDWVNNYNVLDNDVEIVEEMLSPAWEVVDFGLDNIKFWVASIETLLRAKLLAAEDDHYTRRVQDFPDLVDIFRKLRCKKIQHLLMMCNRMNIILHKEYPRNYRRLLKIFPSIMPMQDSRNNVNSSVASDDNKKVPEMKLF